MDSPFHLVADAVLDARVGAHEPVQLGQVLIGLVGHESGEALAVDILESELGAGVARLAAHNALVGASRATVSPWLRTNPRPADSPRRPTRQTCPTTSATLSWRT